MQNAMGLKKNRTEWNKKASLWLQLLIMYLKSTEDRPNKKIEQTNH